MAVNDEVEKINARARELIAANAAKNLRELERKAQKYKARKAAMQRQLLENFVEFLRDNPLMVAQQGYEKTIDEFMKGNT